VFRRRAAILTLLAAPYFFGCGKNPRPSIAPTQIELPAAESVYADLRDMRDRLDIDAASGRNGKNELSSVVRRVLA
jgi:hypothetical protein